MLSFRQLFDHSIEVGGLHEVDELLLGMHVELGVDMVGVRVHRSRGYEQLFLDARGRPAKRKQVEHVDLPFRQAVICADDLAALEQRLFFGVSPRRGHRFWSIRSDFRRPAACAARRIPGIAPR